MNTALLLNLDMLGSGETPTLLTSVQAGDSDDPNTWDEARTPIAGDTFSIGHAVNFVASYSGLGQGGASGSVAINITTGGVLTLEAGLSLSVSGCIRCDNGVFIAKTNTHITFLNGGSAQNYGFILSSTTGQTASRISLEGDAADFDDTFDPTLCVTIDKESGAGNWTIQRGVDNTSCYGGLTANGVVFSDCGLASSAFGSRAIDLVANGATQELHMKYFRLVRCGLVNPRSFPNNRDLHLEYGEWDEPLLTQFDGSSLTLSSMAAGTTGERIIRHIGMRHCAATLGGARGGLDYYNVTIGTFSGSNGATAATRFESIWLASRDSANPPNWFGPGETSDYVVVLFDAYNVNEWVTQAASNTASGEDLRRNYVYQSTFPSEKADGISLLTVANGANTQVWNYQRLIVTLNSRGLGSCNALSAHGTNRQSVKFTHSTISTFDTNDGDSTNAYFGVNTGAEYIGHQHQVLEFEGNAVYSAVPLPINGSNYRGGFGIQYFGLSTVGEGTNTYDSYGFRGTAQAGTTTSLLVGPSSRLWPTAATTKFTAGGTPKIYIYDGAGAVIESRDVADNTNTTVTPATAFSTDHTGREFAIVMKDVWDVTHFGHNAFFNVLSGDIYDITGKVATTIQGYSGAALTNPELVGIGDVDLGTGSSMTADGFMLVDHTQSPINFGSRYLFDNALATRPSQWVTSTAYAVGDRVRNTNASWYDGEELWYRCILAHTSGATTEPAAGTYSLWHQRWEPDVNYQMHYASCRGLTITDAELGIVAVPYCEAAVKWIQAGWTPTNPAMQFAAHDGTTPGAVEGDFPDTGGGGTKLRGTKLYSRKLFAKVA